MSVIGFIGSVFSPWFGWSGRGDPANHCCINVTTSSPGARFTMTDRGRAALRQDRDTLTVGPSRMHWTGTELVIDIAEWGAPPMVGPVRGRIVVTPRAVQGLDIALSPDGAHRWHPYAPLADISVDLGPRCRWIGHGYMDGNSGRRPLEADFATWTWGRFLRGDRATCLYDATRRDGTRLALALDADAGGGLTAIDAPPAARLPRGFWWMGRSTRADPGHRPRDRLWLLDAPFYTRALVDTRIGGEPCLGMHESLDLRRFRQPWLKPMLACRVPRRAGWHDATRPQP